LYFLGQDGTIIDVTLDQFILAAYYGPSSSGMMEVYEVDMLDVPEVNTSTTPRLVPKTIHKRDPDFAKHRPFFGWLSPENIQKTFMHTTQYARLPTRTTLKRAFKSPNPALNVTCRQEPVACNIVYSNVPAIDNGSIASVLFVGINTLVTDVYGIKTDKQFVNTLADSITNCGVPHKLISDSAQANISNKVQHILQTLCVSSWQSKPYQQHENFAERRYQTIKHATNRILECTGAPSYTWLLFLQHVCLLLNHSYNGTIKGVPLQQITGATVDISAFHRFYFWQKVYYKKVDCHFPSTTSVEDIGHIVGISEHSGHALTYKVLYPCTQKIIHRSLVHPVDSSDHNLCAESFGGEIPKVIHSRHDIDDIGTKSKPPITSTAEETHNVPPDVTTEEPPSIPSINPDEIWSHLPFGSASKWSTILHLHF
jgi:hypothetical protein